MRLFDTHFHYYADEDGAPEEYWRRVKTDELAGGVAVGGDFPESGNARRLAEASDNVWFAAGMHPHCAEKFAGTGVFEEFRESSRLVAIGEIGLDYFYEHSERKQQREVMECFLALALEWRLPVIIHCRDREDKADAYADAFQMLRDFRVDGGSFELHCYTGTIGWMEKFLELGSYFGITGMVTFPKSDNIRELLRHIPDQRFLLETDSPYLAPVPHRGKRNHPGYLSGVAAGVARAKGIEVERCAELSTANAMDFFRLPTD